jgi:predicted kinase
MHVIVMSGMSGSGKSTYAKALAAERNVKAWIVSADDFFTNNPSGEYIFEPAKIGEAHGACFRMFMDGVLDKRPLIIVDNTNTTVEEISPYMLAAGAYGYTSEVITVKIPLLFAMERNQHGVPKEEIGAQYLRIEHRVLPPWWNASEVVKKASDPEFYALRPGNITPETDPLTHG